MLKKSQLLSSSVAATVYITVQIYLFFSPDAIFTSIYSADKIYQIEDFLGLILML